MPKTKTHLPAGFRSGSLTVIKEVEPVIRSTGRKTRYLLCKCDCGNEKKVNFSSISNKKTLSCGCLAKKVLAERNNGHGMTGTPIYVKYQGVKRRCESRKSHMYKNYGAKGIKFLRSTFDDFYNDMGEDYKTHVENHGEGSTFLNRKNPNDHYCKENCIWGTVRDKVTGIAPIRKKLLPGYRCGSLLVVKEIDPIVLSSGVTSRQFECKCDCGNYKNISFKNLSERRIKSCGCAVAKSNSERSTHGESRSRFYNIYHGIKSRCNNKNYWSYENYGKRGIKNLRDSFEDFRLDMKESYDEHVFLFGEKNTTIERIDVNGNYCKENCEWATSKEQNNNRRERSCFALNGTIKPFQGKTMAQRSRETGINHSTIGFRIRSGRSYEEALGLVPTERGNSNTNFFGECSIKEAADRYGVSYTTMLRRFNSGKSREQCIEQGG